MADVLITVLEDTINEVAQGDEGSLQAKLTLATMELERAKLANEEMRKSAELEKNRLLKNIENEKNRLLKNMENEKNLLISETRKQCQLEWKQRELELKRVIEDTKRKQWCAQCGREANFYCCWNTSYCDYPCQQLHWGWHAANCAQTRTTAAQETTQSPASSNNMQTVTGLPEVMRTDRHTHTYNASFHAKPNGLS